MKIVEYRKTQHGHNPYIAPGSVRSFGNLPFSSSVSANHHPSAQQDFQLRVFRRPEWQNLSHWEDDESPLGRAYTTFLHASHRGNSTNPGGLRYLDNVPLVDVSLAFRERQPDDPFTADNWACEVHRSFAVTPFSETTRLAGIFSLTLYMRWLLSPSPETYAAVPEIVKPTMKQRLMCHPSSIDMITMRPIKDALIDRMRDFILPLMESGVDINWPGTINEALVCLAPNDPSTNDTGKGKVYIAPSFARHIQNPKIWTLGRSILRHFPELVDSELTISDEDELRPIDRWL